MDKNCDCRKLQKDIEKILKILGYSRFPVEAPRRVVQAKAEGNVKLKNYAEIFEYNLRQIDRAVGFLPMTIEIQDTNAAIAGKQGASIFVESIADGIQQLLEMVADNDKTSDAVLNVAIRALFETGITHKLGAETRASIEEIIEFLGFQVKGTTDEVPCAFDPIAEVLETADKGDADNIENVLANVLKESKVKINYSENIDKNTLLGQLTKIMIDSSVAASGVAEKFKGEADFDNFMESTEYGMNIYQIILLKQIKNAFGRMTKREFQEWIREQEARYTQGRSPVPDELTEPFQQDPAAGFDLRIKELPEDRLKRVQGGQ